MNLFITGILFLLKPRFLSFFPSQLIFHKFNWIEFLFTNQCWADQWKKPGGWEDRVEHWKAFWVSSWKSNLAVWTAASTCLVCIPCDWCELLRERRQQGYSRQAYRGTPYFHSPELLLAQFKFKRIEIPDFFFCGVGLHHSLLFHCETSC